MNISEDTAAVLAGLVRGIDNWYGDPIALTDKLAGLREARHLLRSLGLYSGLKPAQAATGARAAGGDVDAAAKSLVEWLGQAWDDYSGEDRDNAREAVRVVLAAAPPTPSAHGVAELLAECARQQADPMSRLVIPVSEIVRLLAPEGGQS